MGDEVEFWDEAALQEVWALEENALNERRASHRASTGSAGGKTLTISPDEWMDDEGADKRSTVSEEAEGIGDWCSEGDDWQEPDLREPNDDHDPESLTIVDEEERALQPPPQPVQEPAHHPAQQSTPLEGKRLVCSDIRSFFGGGGGRKPVPAAVQPAPKRQRPGPTGGGGGGGGGFSAAPGSPRSLTADASGSAPRPCPFYKIIPATRFAVDAFCFGAVPNVSHYFLTHFHSDHYRGLSGKWTHGPVYCTPVTAQLIMRRLRVRPEYVHQIPLNVPTIVGGHLVELLDANHCPGAALIHIRPPAAPRPAVLHTGDFRAARCLRERADVRELAGRVDTIYLDTTYCDERYAFADQDDAITEAVAAAVAARRAAPRTLIAVGAYAIGKERVYLAIAEALDCKIFVDSGRRALLECFAPDPQWAALRARMTGNPAETPLHVLPIGALNRRQLRQHLAQHSARHDRLLALKPTGWAHTGAGRAAAAAAPAAGAVVVRAVEYSEHSSVEELRMFLQMMRPGRVLATVGVGSPAKRETMNELFRRWLQRGPPPAPGVARAQAATAAIAQAPLAAADNDAREKRKWWGEPGQSH